MVYLGEYEMRSLPVLALSNEAVSANTLICELSGGIQNNDVTFLSMQCNFSSAGKLYLVFENGSIMYLTDPNNDWPASYQILTTAMVPKGETVGLYYSADATLGKLIVVMGGSVF